MEKSFFQEYASIEDTHWWVEARLRLISSFLGDIKPPALALDVGAGTGKTLKFFIEKFGRALGVEPSPEALRLAGRAEILKHTIRGRAESLPIKSDSLDLVSALDVIEHLKDDMVGLREINRVLKKGGTLLITVPAFSFLWSYHDEINHHYRRYSKRELIEKIEKSGFRIARETYFYFLFFPLIAVLRIIRNNLKGRSSSKPSDIKPLPGVVNRLLLILMSVEVFWLSLFSLPCGTSIIVRATKIDG